jgi:hypothetical protein
MDTTKMKTPKDYGCVAADYEEGDISTYRGIVMEYEDAQGVQQVERFFTPPVGPDLDLQLAYAADCTAAEAREKELPIEMIWLSSTGNYADDINPVLIAGRAELEDKEEVTLYSTAMTCGLIAAVAHKVGQHPGDFTVTGDDGNCSYTSDLVSSIKSKVQDTVPIPDHELSPFTFVLRASGDDGKDALHTLLMEIARRSYPDPAILDTLDGKWEQRMDAAEGYSALTPKMMEIAETCNEAVCAIAAILMQEGEITGEEAEKIVAAILYRDIVVEPGERLPCPDSHTIIDLA